MVGATAALALATGCTKTNDAVVTAPGTPAATSAPGTSAGSGTTAPDTSSPGTTTPPKKVPDDQVDAFEASVTADGKDQKLSGTALCRSLDDGKVRIIFGKGDDVDFRLTFPEDLDGEGTVELFDGDTKTGSGRASIDAEPVTARGGRGLGFGFSASFTYDSGEASGTGTMQGTGACSFKGAAVGTTSTTAKVPRSTTTKVVPKPSVSLDVPPRNATAFANDLVTIGKEAFVDEKSWYPADAWIAAGLPKSVVGGYARIADGTKTVVSGFEPLVDKKTDSIYLAFAVADVNGDCAFGILTTEGGTVGGKAQGTESVCTGEQAAKAFGIGG